MAERTCSQKPLDLQSPASPCLLLLPGIQAFFRIPEVAHSGMVDLQVDRIMPHSPALHLQQMRCIEDDFLNEEERKHFESDLCFVHQGKIQA